MDDLVQYLYHSQPTPAADTSRHGLEHLLAEARERNGRLGLTGALLYGAGCFAQVLEGQRSAVLAVAASIGRDRRHHGFTVLREPTPVRQRSFANWAMAGLLCENGTRPLTPTALGLEADTLDMAGDCLLATLRWLVEGGTGDTLPTPARSAVAGLARIPTLIR